MPLPILIYTDAPDHPTGLGRICRELASMIHENLRDTCRVGTLGVFGRGSAKFPWPQYYANGPEDALFNLRQVTEDFFGDERGVLLSITPPSWLFQLSLPQYMAKEDPKWKAYSDWASTRPFEHWAYLAIESHGPFNQYGPTTKAIINATDRRLYYSRWGAEIANNSGMSEPDGIIRYIPHGIDTRKWTPAPSDTVRKFRNEMGIAPNDLLLGCVATNTRRKLIPLFFESAFLLRHQIGSNRLKLWLNTDIAIREYNITELASVYGFRIDSDFLLTSSNAKRPDKWLAAMYSACDITCLPTAGEGFGYPAIESLSCGTPCVTTAFGAQAEFFTGWRDAWVCPVKTTHIITNNTLIEPVYDPAQLTSAMLTAWTELRHRGTLLRDDCRARADQWSWDRVWPVWSMWFNHGAGELQAKLAKAKETVNANDDSEKDVPPENPDSSGLAGDLRGHQEPAGQRTLHDSPWGLDSGALVGLAGEADPAGA